MTTICTGWHPEAWTLYASTFIDMFSRHWPEGVNLVAYVEKPQTLIRGQQRSLWDIRGAKDFIERHQNNPAHNGRGRLDAWKSKEISGGYSYRFDAVRFCKQMFIPYAAAFGMKDGEVLAWFDSDVVTYKDVPANWIEGILGDSELVYMGRERKHSEIGFWAVRLNPVTRSFLCDLSYLYRTDEVFKLAEWHSAFVFDHCLKKFEHIDGGRVKNLTPGSRGHVWFQCELGRYTDHLKGNRKARGYSDERRRMR